MWNLDVATGIWIRRQPNPDLLALEDMLTRLSKTCVDPRLLKVAAKFLRKRRTERGNMRMMTLDLFVEMSSEVSDEETRSIEVR